VATDTYSRPWLSTTVGTVVADAALVLGALALAGEAAVHFQQYAELMHDVRWIGPLFLANGAACIAVIAALVFPPTRQLAALAGVVISALALGSLIVSYGRQGGLFGFEEFGFRAAIIVAMSMELAAVVFLSTALAARTALVPARRDQSRSERADAGAGDDERSPGRQMPWRAGRQRTA
jgi:hypothetical protein